MRAAAQEGTAPRVNDVPASSADSAPSGVAARAAALEILSAALSRRGGLDEGLTHPSLGRLEPRDRAFARALAMATLRRLGPIDAALQARLKKPPPERVVNVLRLGAAQLLALGVPDHAAVGATVDLVAAQKGGHVFKGLVNAVLRGLSRERPSLDDPALLAPQWLAARWSAAYGPDDARAIAAAIAEEPATDLTERDGGQTRRADLKGDIATWPGFDTGDWWVQDAAAAIPARLLGVQPGQTVLDLCAAPGGKTLQLAAAGGQVTAVDRSAPRLKRVTENLARTRLSAEIVAAEGATWNDRRQFDAVLLDAPCSATGTFRRHPDVLWVASPADIPRLAAMQSSLLDSAARRVKPGGRLVYCVCSLEPEEGEGQVAAFLARTPNFSLEPVASGEGDAPAASLRPDGTLRILPHHREGGMDGFYVARFRRAADEG